MRPQFDTVTWQDAAILVVIAVLCLLLFPFFSWWTSLAPPWYVIYLLWAFIIALALLLERRFRDYDV